MAKKADPQLDASVRMLVLYGPEDMLKRAKLDELRDALTVEHGEVETFTFDGLSATLSDVFDELRGYSLMQTYKAVIVDNADEFTKNHRDALDRYADNPVDHATLVLRAQKWNKGNLDKKIAKMGAVIKCDAPKPAEAAKWLAQRAKSEHGVTLAPEAGKRMVDHLGTHLTALDTELAKLAVMVGDGEPITADLVDSVVGRSNDESAWVVQDAVLRAMGSPRGGKAALEAVHDLIDVGGQPEVLVMYFVADLMRKFAVASTMKRQGVPAGAIGKALKLWGPRQQLFMTALSRLDPDTATALFRRAAQRDMRSKSGLGDARRNLECFCVELADSV